MDLQKTKRDLRNGPDFFNHKPIFYCEKNVVLRFFDNSIIDLDLFYLMRKLFGICSYLETSDLEEITKIPVLAEIRENGFTKN